MATPPAAAAAAGGNPPRRTLFRASNLLLLLLLGMVLLSICGAVGDDEATTTTTAATTTTSSAVKPHGHPHQIGDIGPIADDYRLDFIPGKHDEVDAPMPLVRGPGKDTSTDSSAMTTAHRRREELEINQGRQPLAADGFGGEDSQAVMIRRRGEESLRITRATLKKIQDVVIVQHEGIVYCPIPKTGCSEWRRTLRWIVGVNNWNDGQVHQIVKNGLERLADRGLEETRWAFESDRLMRFVVVREPAERLVSAFLNKCVIDGYESEKLAKKGLKNCKYLDIMPELFPDTERASLASHARFKELAEADPEDTFYHFINGIWREAEAHGDACQIPNLHFRPQACFCDLPNLLPAYHVMLLSNLSAEAKTFASRLPAALPDSHDGVELDLRGVADSEDVAASDRKTGVDEARREEIDAFLRERFIEFHTTATKGVTHAADSKNVFLSERVMAVVDKIYAKDYHLLGEYLQDLGQLNDSTVH